MLIADQVSQLVEVVFDHTRHPVLGEAWLGLGGLYKIQIYFDFSRLLQHGHRHRPGAWLHASQKLSPALPVAIDYGVLAPLAHIAVELAARLYLYIPLGGNRYGPARTYRNLITVFLLCGLWHGASWNFVLWGVMAWRLPGSGSAWASDAFCSKLPPVLRWAYALLAVMGGWVLFRAHDLASAGRMYSGLVGKFGVGSLSFETHAALAAGRRDLADPGLHIRRHPRRA